MKTCTSCGCTKPLDSFYKSKSSKDGHETKCKACRNEQLAAYRIANIEKVRAHDRERNQQPHRVAARYDYAKSDAGRASARKTQRKWNAIFPERRAARMAVMLAVRQRRLLPWPACAVPDCTCTPEAHHPDYSRPLDVVWLCDGHHKAAHKLGRELDRAAV